ncbi:MAG TPA: sodium:proton antiporter NhaD [Ohtaekwangia sp.]
METAVIIVFILGYIAIAFEHPIRINKTASAILTGMLCWTLFMLASPNDHGVVELSDKFERFIHHWRIEAGDSSHPTDHTVLYREFVISELAHHLSKISEILFFLMGAMTIVELIDAHQGFQIITSRIKTKNPKTLIWIICWVTFFLSAILDNLTTTIVMVSVVRKLIPDRQMKLLFIGMIIIAANAGGAWTPIGDVTTTMLWIGGQISSAGIMKSLFIPSVVCMLVPLLVLHVTMKGSIGESVQNSETPQPTVPTGNIILVLGLGVLVMVPLFKTITHMPPYAGILLGLGILWAVSEIMNPELDEAVKKQYTVAGALSRIDVPSILFFLGILLAVGALESMQVLQQTASWLDENMGDQRIIVTLTGLLSAVVDNVPLVAASMGMYSKDVYPQDHMIWEYLAYCAGTGGSILIIGSAAGVAAMGIEKIDFLWYAKKIGILALLGYLAGAAVYLLMLPLFH